MSFALVVVLLISVLAVLASVAVRAKRREKVLLHEKSMLEDISQAKIEIFQDISHDLKTPLIVISTTLHNITDMVDFNEIDEAEMAQGLKNAQSEIMRLSRMVDSTLRLSLFSDSKTELALLDITDLLREVASIYRTLLGIRNNKLHLEMPASLPTINGSKDLLVHVLVNLLSNSNKYTHSGDISIKTTAGKSSVDIIVSDNGAGIDAKMQECVFERGVSDGSTGIGLSICKAIIEEIHGGTISIQSQVGQGTTVKFTIPIAEGKHA